jgi:isopentenyl phosphate kinase
VTIELDDSGWGDPIGGVFIGVLRVETNEYLVKEIEVTHFQEPNFAQKTFLARGLELVMEIFKCLQVPLDEPIHVCRGAVLDGVRKGLIAQNYQVIPTKIEGKLQELVEANFVASLERLGISGIPRVSGKERFFRQLEWIQEDLKNREQYAKTGWKNWSTKLRNWHPRWRHQQPKSSSPPLIIKLGGSVISDKTTRSKARFDMIRQLVSEIAQINSFRVIVIHGGGSFGHFPAKEYELHRGGRSKKKRLGLTETALEMSRLTQYLIEAFYEVQKPAIPIHASSVIVSLDGRISHMDIEALREFLRQGFIPILSGDVAADTVTNFTIISGDQIAMYLARLFNAPRVIFATDVDGLYTADPKKIPTAKRIDVITPDTLNQIFNEIAVGVAPETADVTEGMRGKLTEIFKGLPKHCEVLITDIRKPGTLQRIVAGESVPSTSLRHSS